MFAIEKMSTESTNILNISQKQAVNYEEGHLLIIAGPGTGKTHTLIHRIVHISQNLSNTQKILAITFTNKAAMEMKERLDKYLSNVFDVCCVGTFHQFCLQILRQYSLQTGLPKDFSVASQDEAAAFAENKDALKQISRWKSIDFDKNMPQEVQDYNIKLRAANQLDFDDLILETVKLLRSRPEVLYAIQSIYPFIYVDEYQDINCIQHALLNIFVGTEGHITAIGDPNQAIYSFRGSDSAYFNTFVQDFPKAKNLTLVDNYRSAESLLSASGQVIAKGKSLNVPELTANICTKGRLIIHESPTDKAEAEYVVHQVEKMIGGTSMFSQDSGRVENYEEAEQSFGDIVVLYRLNSQRFALQKAFERSGIPYQVSGMKKNKKSGNIIDDLYNAQEDEIGVNVEKVSLMTIHASKGLEFSSVFIVGCEESILPLNICGLKSDEEEERRLFYVAMTRAKHYLFLISAKHRYLYGKAYQNKVSPFLFDIEEQLKEYSKVKSKPKKIKKEDAQMTLF